MEHPSPIQETGTNLSSKTPPRLGHPITSAGPAVNLLSGNEDESDVSDNDAEEESKSTITAAAAFYNRWNPAIGSCLSRAELDRVVENCVAEWHLLTLKGDKAAVNGRQPGNRERESGTRAAPSRQQSRQQQRIRRKDNAKKWEEASRI